MTWRKGAVRATVRFGALALLALCWETLAHVKTDARLYPPFEHLFAVSLPSLGVFSSSAEVGYRTAFGVLVVHSAITIGRIICALILATPLGIGLGLIIH